MANSGTDSTNSLNDNDSNCSPSGNTNYLATKTWHKKLTQEPLRRPRAETAPPDPVIPNNIRNPTHVFTSSLFNAQSQPLWDGQPHSPTSDQLLREDSHHTIASTFASLGLDDSRTLDNRRTIHASHSYSSLQFLAETHQQQQQQQQIPYDSFLKQRPPLMDLRLQGNRPRAMSAVDSLEEQQQQQQQQQQDHPPFQSIWHPRLPLENNIRRPFLRNSNSSADLLEMMARQRKASTASSSPIYHQDEPDLATPPTAWESFEDAEIIPHGQIPSRSLWIGQLDLSITTNDLNNLFSKFGSIESIRILPDRECAFINYFGVEEALRAKDALIHKMNSKLGNSTIKVGFGKSESVPQQLSSSTSSQSSQSQLLTDSVQEPTRALWIGNIPSNTTQVALGTVFSTFGAIESVRVLPHKNCGFINFFNLEDAIRAKKSLYNREIMGPGTGVVKIGYAKVPSLKTMEDDVEKEHQQYQQQVMMYMMTEMMTHNPNMVSAIISERKMIMQDFGEDEKDGPMFQVLHLPQHYFHTIPAAPELGQSRKVDIAKLRDIRKRLDNGQISVKELEIIAVECLDELVELCSDYIGNTVIQRLFEKCSEMTKSLMLERVAPYLASIGVHKNGTWAAQKIIDTAKLPAQVNLICEHIKPYVPALLLDQFGNYVVQCCLSLGPLQNQFIFDAIVDSCWEIAQGRFGARAVRATLESPHVTKRQQKYVAASLVQHALLLATNANGALLLIWLLDTSGIPGRYRVLAPRLLPHLARLCTHKLASLTVLKLINQRQEPDARAVILDALFFTPQYAEVTEEILHDQVHGVNLIQKILSSSYIELKERQRIAERVKQMLYKLKLQHIQGYKRLVEEINMVMVDSVPGASLGAGIPSQFTISPSLAAALHAKYVAVSNGMGNEEQLEQPQSTAAMMANFYAAAVAASISTANNNAVTTEEKNEEDNT